MLSFSQIRRPSPELIECHKPKPILLATGEMKFPFNWQPNILPLQLISIGNFNTNPNSGSRKSALVLAALPAEFTTMSGRRLRNRILKTLKQGLVNQPPVIEPQQPVEPAQPPAVSSLMATHEHRPQLIDQNGYSPGDYSVIRQKRYLHLYRFLPMNRMQSFSDRVHSLSDSYLMPQNQPLQINDQGPPPPPSASEQQPPSGQPMPEQPQDPVHEQHLNQTLQDASHARETNTELSPDGYLSDNRVILSGLSNTYSSYVTTFEEYQHQRYEAASTVYGAYTLQAYLQEFSELTQRLMDPNLNLSRSSFDEDNVRPPNLLSKQFQFKMPVVYDGVKFNAKFGDLIMDARPAYKPGEMVKVIFRAG